MRLGRRQACLHDPEQATGPGCGSLFMVATAEAALNDAGIDRKHPAKHCFWAD
jgi:hypothetical protein